MSQRQVNAGGSSSGIHNEKAQRVQIANHYRVLPIKS